MQFEGVWCVKIDTVKKFLALTSSVCLHTARGMCLNDSSGQMILYHEVCSSSVLSALQV